MPSRAIPRRAFTYETASPPRLFVQGSCYSQLGWLPSAWRPFVKAGRGTEHIETSQRRNSLVNGYWPIWPLVKSNHAL